MGSGPEQPPEPLLFAEVGALCETAMHRAGVDGTALAALVSSQSRELVYATDYLAERIDELQFTVGEGPCLEAYGAQLPQLCPSLAAATPRRRWPAFSAGVLALGVEAVFAFPVLGPQHPLGVLELYRRTAGPLRDEQLDEAHRCAMAIGQTISAAARGATSAAEATRMAEAALIGPGNPFARPDVTLAAQMVAAQLGVAREEAMARIRAHAYARDMPVTLAAAEIVAGRLQLHV